MKWPAASTRCCVTTSPGFIHMLTVAVGFTPPPMRGLSVVSTNTSAELTPGNLEITSARRI